MQIQFDIRFFFTIFCILVAGYSAGKAFLRLWKLLKLGKDENLFENIPQRIQVVIKNVLGQKKLFKDFWPGLQHALIFWGFIIVTIGTVEHIIEGLFHGFSFDFLGPLYGIIVLLQEWAHPIVFLAALFGLYRRFILKPKRLESDWEHTKDAVLILSLTAFLMLANIITFACYVRAGHPHAMEAWRPLSSFLSEALLQGISPDQALSLGYWGWAAHLATVFYFLHYIPNSKHLHVITAGPNFFFSRLDNKGSFSQINFEDESLSSFGVSKLQDFSWKDILDAYSCTSCGRCNEFCPTATTGKALRPMKLIEDFKHHIFHAGDELLKNPEATASQTLIGEDSGITHDTLWDCTSCRACVEACPVGIEHIDKIVDMRRNLVMMEGSMPAELQTTMKNWENNSNPWGMSQDSRDEWAKNLEVPRLAEKPDAEYLFYVGCAGSFNDRNKKISTAIVKILQKAQLSFAILGKEELCNGETARRAGNEYLAKTMIDANIETFKKYNVKKVIASCPHCFNTIKNEYPEFGFQPEEVLHHSELIQHLIDSGKLTPQKADQTKIAFHDSCYLGRYNDIYESPRDALKNIPGIELLEMPRKKETGLCCGAGGARMWMEETQGKRINVERVEEALDTKPDVIAAGCPFCQVMLEDGVTEKGQQDTVLVKDIAEIVADQI